MGQVVLDASVLLGLLDSRDAHHDVALRSVAAVIENGDTVVLPASVLAEALVAAARQGPEVRDAAESQLLSRIDRLHPIDREVAVHAADIRARHPATRLPDALVVATGRAVDGRVLTADKGWSSVDRRVEVIGS